MGNCQCAQEPVQDAPQQVTTTKPVPEKPIEAKPGYFYAIAALRGVGTANKQIQGIVKFIQDDKGVVTISAKVKGLKPGKHGFHIHEFGNLQNGQNNAGDHYNPYRATHGSPGNQQSQRHVGDLGNIEVLDENTEASFQLKDKLVQLDGQYSVIGRSILITENEDDLGVGRQAYSRTTGSSGNSVAWAEIGRCGPIEI